MNNFDEIVFIDTEITYSGKMIDLGAAKSNGIHCHSGINGVSNFISSSKFVCGHNIINYDIKYIKDYINMDDKVIIDTLFISPLLFPKYPYHKLLKDDKIQVAEFNNPLHDAIKTKELFDSEIQAFNALPEKIKIIYTFLLSKEPEFKGFFDFVNYKTNENVDEFYIKEVYSGKICSNNATLQYFIDKYPIELAYALAIIGIDKSDTKSVTPPWVLKNYPKTEYVLHKLCATPCNNPNCSYCNTNLNIHKELKKYFGYDKFRLFDGRNLQEEACKSAIYDDSLLVVFPTGGGKSLTFQLPALVSGEVEQGLTVVISPLQSLMKDQIDTLYNKGILAAVTINGLLSPVERKKSIEDIQNGKASMVYISPEQLRSNTIYQLLLSRNIARFVIDEAHCFSEWGQDFRVDYLYIGNFIKKLKADKGERVIPVSCFTATAQQQVVKDISTYFLDNLSINLKRHISSKSICNNLHFSVISITKDNIEDNKYREMRNLIESKSCPTIVYVNTVKETEELSNRLEQDGFNAKPYNGQMDSKDKREIQDGFISNKIQIIIATSAFGMGVDKPDIGLIIHYDVPDSLERYIQETGRAARKEDLQADCYILFNDSDLNKNFSMLTQTKVNLKQIQQVWGAIKRLTNNRTSFCASELEIAREAGWKLSSLKENEIKTKIKTALLGLEKANYIKRGDNIPRVYATSINAHNVTEARNKIEKSGIFSKEQQENAIRIIVILLSKYYTSKSNERGVRVDFLADLLGMEKKHLIDAIHLMRQINLLKDDNDITVILEGKIRTKLNNILKLEEYLIDNVPDKSIISLKELNAKINDTLNNDISCDVKKLRYIFNFWLREGYVNKECRIYEQQRSPISFAVDNIKEIFQKREHVALLIVDYLIQKQKNLGNNSALISFSAVELLQYISGQTVFKDTKLKDVESALLYLHLTKVLILQSGFMIFYSALQIERIEKNNRIQYKKEDYQFLNDYYKRKISKIHFMGELCKKLQKEPEKYLEYINDYFYKDNKDFINKYFFDRSEQIKVNMTPKKYQEIFGALSKKQKEIIDDESQFIVVAAGPGSGKTRVLVHKLASLLTLEDVKSEQLLMLTFSHTAAVEFRKRLFDLIGKAAKYVEIRTFHSFCFDILGRPGTLKGTDDIVKRAIELIKNQEADPSKISKSVLVIDEAQDIAEDEFELINNIIEYNNNDIRFIAVGDDDQSIFDFRGSSSKYLKSFITKYKASPYEMIENYRSSDNIVQFANAFSHKINNRIKSKDGIAVKNKSKKKVNIFKCKTENLYVPLVNSLAGNNLNGSIAVLTQTNEEALKVVRLLNKKNIPAKLIQSLDSFSLLDLLEIRSILDYFNQNNSQIQIEKNVWDKMKEELKTNFSRSTNLAIICNMLKKFEESNVFPVYFSDLETFFSEAKLEDYYDNYDNKVIVSTIHKSKGHEYDNVFMLLNNPDISTDERKRVLYVGFTRAKDLLNIFVNDDILQDFEFMPFINNFIDYNTYYDTDEIVLQLDHKEVNLGYFPNTQDFCHKLMPGDELIVNGNYLLDKNNNRILMFSKKEITTLTDYIKKGYKPIKAEVRFMVYWTDKNTSKKYLIVLPNIYLKK